MTKKKNYDPIDENPYELINKLVGENTLSGHKVSLTDYLKTMENLSGVMGMTKVHIGKNKKK